MTEISVPESLTVPEAPADPTSRLVDNIHAIGDTLRENAVLADKQRVLPDTTVEVLRSVGALDISTLRRYGGYEAGARTLLEVARAVGFYDPAAAWVTVISNGSVMLANRFDDDVLDVVFAEGTVPMASVFASPQGEAIRDGAGYRVSGEWPFSSNIMHSAWAIGILTVKDAPDAEPYTGFALFRRDEFTIKGTWYTIGMRGAYTIYKHQADSGAFVQGLGAASMKIDTALLQLRRAADAIDAAAAGTTPMPLDERARYRGGIGHSGYCLVEAMNDLV
jgi:hypothetical protein